MTFFGVKMQNWKQKVGSPGFSKFVINKMQLNTHFVFFLFLAALKSLRWFY